jgi:predicted glycoside hydrolase/deacetylase ChbG (UPF0249 family)
MSPASYWCAARLRNGFSVALCYTQLVRRLIINADDFGLTKGVDRGIARGHEEGLITSTTLMANAGAFGDAVEAVAKLNGTSRRFSIGCHVVLMDGEPLLAADHVGSLLGEGGRFRDSLLAFAGQSLRGRLKAEEIEAEASAQMRKIASAGIRLSHFDAHKHAHMFPAVLKPLLRAARSCGVGAVRNPFAPLKPLAFAHLARRPHLWKRYSEVRVLRGWERQFRELVAREGMATTDGTFGIVVTGALDLALFEAIVGCMPEGTWEFCCHPGYNDDDLGRVRTRLRESRERELDVLTSDAAREVLERHGVELISYWELQGK